MLRFHLMTVPHTGTRFLNQLFFKVGFRNIQESNHRIMRRPENVITENTFDVEYRMNHWEITPNRRYMHTMPSVITKNRPAPVLTTLRHPYETAISWATRREQGGYTNLTFENLLSAYDNMIGCSGARPLYYFDISCPKEKRLSHIVNILKDLGVYEYADKDILIDYVNNWKHVGSTRSELKEYYAEHGTPPPELYNWSRFDRAVKWYNMKLQECKYDNLTS